jgi:hypothetical protein
MLHTIKELKERYKGYKEKRFLETHGCKTWRQYERKHDSDIGPLARVIKNYYHGYPHVWGVPVDNHHPIHTIDKMEKWCEQNCQGKWRNDWHRGFYDNYGNFEINIIGTGDHMFFAFKDERDYIWFTLRWA